MRLFGIFKHCEHSLFVYQCTFHSLWVDVKASLHISHNPPLAWEGLEKSNEFSMEFIFFPGKFKKSRRLSGNSIWRNYLREEEEEPHFRRFVASFSTTRTTTLKYQINVHVRQKIYFKQSCLKEIGNSKDFSIEKSPKIVKIERMSNKRHLAMFLEF